MVPVDEITDPTNDYNLNIPRYIDASEPEDLHDLGAHLNGGIPDTDIDALDKYWTVFPTLRTALFKANGRPGYSDPQIDTYGAVCNRTESCVKVIAESTINRIYANRPENGCILLKMPCSENISVFLTP